MRGEVFALCISLKKGEKKREVDQAEFVPGWGLKDDIHAGPGARQVSLLSSEDAECLKKDIPGLKPGDFGENISTRGFNLDLVKIGDRIIIGENIFLEVSQIGKVCHSGCEIQKKTGKCIMPQRGVFAKVINGGRVKKGDPIQVLSRASNQRPPRLVNDSN